MRFYGYVIHSKQQIKSVLQRCCEIASRYNLKFRKGNREDYSWKIEGFEKVSLFFYSLPKNVNFPFLLNLFKEITLVEPTIVSLKIEKECHIDFNHYNAAEEFGSTKAENIFAILGYEGNLDDIEITQSDLQYIKKCNS
ncbi:MAG: hypothetical protein IJ445_05100 [Clostridia bacterium]|nr:hypothetical protein [Clostridia bacterium]